MHHPITLPKAGFPLKTRPVLPDTELRVIHLELPPRAHTGECFLIKWNVVSPYPSQGFIAAKPQEGSYHRLHIQVHQWLHSMVKDTSP